MRAPVLVLGIAPLTPDGTPAPDAFDADIAALMPPPDAPAATRPWWRRALPTLLGFVGGGVIGVGVAMVGLPALDGLPRGASIALLAGYFVSLWPHIVLHEAGHAAAGIARGMQAIAFGVGPFRLERGSDGRWRWRHGGGIAGVGGFAALLPRDARGLSRRDQAVFLLGGPTANLATAALTAAAAAWLPMPTLLAVGLLGVALAAATMGLGNLLPLHVQGWRSDGRGLLDLLRQAPDAALQLQINQLMALSLAGVRARDWPKASMPAADAGGSSAGLRQTAQLLRLSRAIDLRDRAAARADALALTAAFNGAAATWRASIAVNLAVHAALLVGDRGLIAAWRAHCEGGLLDLSPYRAWLDAEIAVHDGDPGAALSHLEQAAHLAPRIPDAASRLVFDERLTALRAEITTPADNRVATVPADA